MVEKYLEKEEKSSQSPKLRPSKQKMASHLICQHILSFHSIVNKRFTVASGNKEMVPNKEKDAVSCLEDTIHFSYTGRMPLD